MLGRRAAIGTVLMVVARLLARLFDLATMLVLARLLDAASFGLVAIAMSLVAIVEAALELPLNAALVRLPTITKRQYDTAFTLSLLRGGLLAVIVVALAWPFAGFYHDQRLALLICVLAVSPIARALASPALAAYQKELSFWRDFVIELSGKLVGFAVAVSAAVLTRSYWAIAAGTVVFPLAMAAVSYALAPYRPRLSLSELRLFAGFVGWTTAAQWLSAFNWQFERLLLGKTQSKAGLGLFTTASDITYVPFQALFGPMMRPLLAAFSHQREEPARLARSYQIAANAGMTLGLPTLVGLSLVADPTVRLVLGERWLGAIPLLHWLAIALLPALLALPSTPLIMSFGDTRSIFRRSVLDLCTKFPIAVIGVLAYGFYGIVAARLVSEFGSAAYSMIVVRRLAGLSVKDQLWVSWRSVAATLIMIVPVQAALASVGTGGGVLHAAAGLGGAVLVGAGVYGGALAVLWRLAGRPHGVESIAISLLSGLAGTARGRGRIEVV